MKIDRLVLALPPGFAKRAPIIARLVARELASAGKRDGGQKSILTAPQVSIPRGASDGAAARLIAKSIGSAISRSNGAR